MNILLFDTRELQPDGRLVLSADRRLEHLRSVLGCEAGDGIRVGELDGRCGRATVSSIDRHRATLDVVLDSDPPPGLDVTLVMALPRPKMLRRILRASAELGVKELHLIHSFRVEKGYWQSPVLQPSTLQDYLVAGLEQASDTVLPRVTLHRRFRPFAEDALPGIIGDRDALLAHPDSADHMPERPPAPGLLVIGPEGGFIPFEVDCLRSAGCRPVSLGRRVLRVETILPSLLGRYL